METNILAIVMFANDNHLCNVKTLQSIFKQDYTEIHLVICNDCTNYFQAERLLYNFGQDNPEQHTNVKKIHLCENRLPKGEWATVKSVLNDLEARYVYIIHSGEYFVKPDVLSKCIEQADLMKAEAVLAPLELWSDDMKQCVETQIYDYTCDCRENVEEEDTGHFSQIRDSMVLYRKSTLCDADIGIDSNVSSISQIIVPSLYDKDISICEVTYPICKYSLVSIKDEHKDLPKTFGNQRLKTISDLIDKQNTAKSNSKGVNNKVGKQKKLSKLYTMSRFKRIKTYIMLDFAFGIMFVVLACARDEIINVASVICFGAAVVVFLGVVVAVIINLYYKRNPERIYVQER